MRAPFMKTSLIAALGLALAPIPLAVSACGNVTDLSVGQITATPEGGATITLDKLEARCAAAPGQVDSFKSAAELSSRLSGRWYHCTSNDPNTNWALPRGTGMIYSFDQDGTWALLDYADAQQTFTPSADPDRNGALKFYVVTGVASDSGTGDNDAGPFDGMFIPLDETTTRYGIFLRQQRLTDDYQFEPSFDQNPRRLHLHELNLGGVSADFVPIDE
jgi:hypothetical protein